MNELLKNLIANTRFMILIMVFFAVGGWVAYHQMPKEADPDVPIPLFWVNAHLEGASAQDMERLVARPLETHLRNLSGLKEITANVNESNVTIHLEFDVGIDYKKTFSDIKDRVDDAKKDLPKEVESPMVGEVNIALFPVLSVNLSGNIPFRALQNLALELKEDLEALPQILEVELRGEREEVAEVLIDKSVLETYSIALAEVLGHVLGNNKLIAAGTLDDGASLLTVKVPGLYENVEDILETPIKTVGERVIRMRDVCAIVRTFKDPESLAQFNGNPTFSLHVKKRIGANILSTIDAIKATALKAHASMPAGVTIDFSADKSLEIKSKLSDLENGLLLAVILVMAVVLGSLGWRASVMVGFAVPMSFLMGLWVLRLMGMSLNNMVLFSLILVSGMLVDGAVIVVEFADRKMREGMSRSVAYLMAAQRMAWPIFSSTLTTILAFVPMLVWPGIVGEFMKYLPITLIAVLSASLVVAFVFVPVLGSLWGAPGPEDPAELRNLRASETGDFSAISGFTGTYVHVLQTVVKRPGLFLGSMSAFLMLVYVAYGQWGRGVEFFPDIEPERLIANVHVRSDLSIWAIDELVQKVADELMEEPAFASVYAVSSLPQQNDICGTIFLELSDWQHRPKGKALVATWNERLAQIPGVKAELELLRDGPPMGKPLWIQLMSADPEALENATAAVRRQFEKMPGLINIEDSRPAGGIEWAVDVDRTEAGRYGIDVASVGNAVRLVTGGLQLSSYRPNDARDEVDIRGYYLPGQRHFGELSQLRLATPLGLIPLSHFATIAPKPKVDRIERIGGLRTFSVKADLEEGLYAKPQIDLIKAWIEAEKPFDSCVELRFRGEDEEREKSEAFLTSAFIAALILIAAVLVAQFNSFYDALLVLTAVVFSTVGVLLGLLITDQPFGVIMSGIGVIALAGVVVNNNIVLIDTYNILRSQGLDAVDAVLRTGAQRLRPVLLTTSTAILGLLPMVFGLTIDFFGREVSVGAPSTQWWQQLATAIAFGLAFATILTLLLTPALLVLGDRIKRRWKKPI